MVAERHAELVREAIDDLRERGDEAHASAVESVLQFALSPHGDDPVPDGYLTAAEAGKQFGIGARQLREWVNSGRLPGLKQGRRLLVSLEELRSFLAPSTRDGEVKQ